MVNASKATAAFTVFITILVIFFSGAVLSSRPAGAVEGLLIRGVVKRIDYSTGTIVVDVKSLSCRGVRKFRVDDPADMDGYQGKVMAFFIDSSACLPGKVYRIVRFERVQR